MPTNKPKAIARDKLIDFISNVITLRNPFIIKPVIIYLISKMPDLAVYKVNDLTSLVKVNVNIVYAEVS